MKTKLVVHWWLANESAPQTSKGQVLTYLLALNRTMNDSEQGTQSPFL